MAEPTCAGAHSIGMLQKIAASLALLLCACAQPPPAERPPAPDRYAKEEPILRTPALLSPLVLPAGSCAEGADPRALCAETMRLLCEAAATCKPDAARDCRAADDELCAGVYGIRDRCALTQDCWSWLRGLKCQDLVRSTSVHPGCADQFQHGDRA